MANRKTYLGKLIDLESLQRKNEKTSAMGNMGVNAKGDTLGPGGKVIEPANSRSRTHYQTKRTTVNNRGSLKAEPSKDETKVFDETDRTRTPEESKKTAPKKVTKQKAQAAEIKQDNGDIVYAPVKGADDSTDS
jgi:hypothetical protein